MKLLIILLNTCLSINAVAALPLHFEKMYYGKDKKEISGLTYKDGKLYAIADKAKNHYIYEINFHNDSFSTKKAFNLNDSIDFQKYLLQNLFYELKQQNIKTPVSLDIEGITSCGNEFYLANEQARHFFSFSKNNTFNFNNLFLQDVLHNSLSPAPTTYTLNAGFEGIAIDCDNQILYLAFEREPYKIMAINMATNKVTDIFSIEIPDMPTLGISYSDLYFDKGYLYLLVRTLGQIYKIEPHTHAVIAQYDFLNTNAGFNPHHLYQQDIMYGNEEGLALTEDKIFIAFDNNQAPLMQWAQNRFGLDGNFGMIMQFARPAGF